MAPQTPKRLVSDTLENLSEVDFQKFCQALLDRRDGGRRLVRRNQVEGKGFLEVSDVMVRTFTEKNVVNVAVEILRDIGCCQDAEDLADDADFNSSSAAGSGSSSAAGSGSSAAGSGSSNIASSNGEHFVDKYRDQLIQRVSNISAILDQLLKENVITCEGYEEIRSKPTNAEKMRAIIFGPMKQGRACKDIFYKILKKQEMFLINDLEGN